MTREGKSEWTGMAQNAAHSREFQPSGKFAVEQGYSCCYSSATLVTGQASRGDEGCALPAIHLPAGSPVARASLGDTGP
jgi:hypothetical protein